MVSSEFPNTAKAIRDQPPERANNKIYWNNLNNGDTLYSITVPPGNYTPDELESTMNELFAQTCRIPGYNGTPEFICNDTTSCCDYAFPQDGAQKI